MSSPDFRRSGLVCCLAAAWLLLLPSALGQSTSGRIIGRVSDTTGAVVNGVNVTIVNEATGVSRSTKTNDTGDFTFVEVTPGNYHVTYALTGFKREVRSNVVLELNQVLTLNAVLQPGGTQETVDVTSEAPLVDTTSTQLGAVVNNRSINELPLNQRDTYQFLQLQPGVQSVSGSSNSLFYGSGDPGSVSVNGGRDRANNFSVNGGDANDQFANLPTVQPTPDSVEEFRVLTNTFDAEYGRNSGAVVNVITKSGSNKVSGDLYEYFRNTVLDSQGYLNTAKPQFNQNQFGGTLGGPIVKDKSFFFVSYEGRRVRQGQPSDTVFVPTPDEKNGIFGGGFGGTLNDQFTADVLNSRSNGQCGNDIAALSGAPATGGEDWSAIFPTGQIPASCFDPVAAALMNALPAANTSFGAYQTAPTSRDRQDQFTARWDHRISDNQNFTAYYYFTDEGQFQPFSFFQAAGANLPGYGSNVGQRFQQYNLTHAWTLNNAMVNEARFTYMREGQLTFQHPQNTTLIASSCPSSVSQFCFTGLSDSSVVNSFVSSQGISPSKAGITPGLGSNHEGLPFITINGGAVIGNNFEGELPQVGNTFQWADNLSVIKGSHTMKFGADVRRSRFDQTLYYNVNGSYTFDSTGNNAVDYTDNYPGFLLGLADSYTQGSAQRENVRNTGLYLFAQDSWKIKPSLTLNYGLRWELDTPLTDVLHHVQTFRPGQVTLQYPCQLSAESQAILGTSDCTSVFPTGLVFPGDKGVPAGMTSTYYKAFAPRIGVAWSPDNGKTSIRTGWGMFYNPMEQLVLEQFGAEPPFGGSNFLTSTFFNTPFVEQSQTLAPNPFNGVLSPPPGTPIDWSLFRSILLYGEFQPHLRTQYSDQYNFTIQRELAKDLVWQIGYVGSQGHRLLAAHDINPAIPQTCLDIISIANADPAAVTSYGSPGTCGPTLEDNQYSVTVPNGFPFHMPGGGVVTGTGQTLQFVGLRPYSSPNCNAFTGVNCPSDGVPVFANIFAEDTIANSSYNSFQTSLEKRFSHGLQFQAAYTFSKSLDQASSFEETLNPFNFGASRALSLFNAAHRFVINYYWDIPAPKYDGFLGKLADDWSISGITEFQSGFPIRLQTQDDNELISSIFFLGTTAPQLTGSLQRLDPRSSAGHFYLNPAQFSDPPLGTFAATPRSICCGPGLSNWDITIGKRIVISEAKYFQFRADIFNLFNHTEWVNPDGNFSDTTFGQVLQTRDPRLVQFALKLFF